MKVAFDLSSTRGQKTGIGRYTANLLDALRRYAPEVEALLLGDGVPASLSTPSRIWHEQIGLVRLAQRAAPDVLHLTGFAAPLRAGFPVVLTVHDLIGVLFPSHFPPVSRFYWSRYLPFTLRFAARLIADSDRTRDDIVHLTRYPAHRIHVIPPGRDERFRPASASELNAARAALNLPNRYFLFVGTLEPRKGIDTLVAAYARVAAELPHQLVIAGKPGWHWEALTTQIQRLGLEARIRLLNYVEEKHLPALYTLAEALVFPSRYEGFGLPPLEAMACGTPVIASNSSSLPEVLGEAGLLVPPDDVAGFAAAMRRLTAEAALASRLREQGLARALTFTWERTARRMAAVYAETLCDAHQR